MEGLGAERSLGERERFLPVLDLALGLGLHPSGGAIREAAGGSARLLGDVGRVGGVGWWAEAAAPPQEWPCCRGCAAHAAVGQRHLVLDASFSSWRPEPARARGGQDGSGETSFGGVGGKVKRCGLECPADREEDEAGG